MKTILFILEKEFKQIRRDTMMLRVILIMPVIQLVVMPLAADYEIKNINISIVDHDHSTWSRQLSQKIIASGYFRMNDFSPTFNASFIEFQKDHADLILEIPEGFERSLITGHEKKLLMAVNAINGTKASVGSGYLSRIIGAFNQDIRESWFEPMRQFPIPVITVSTINRFNPNLNYPFFMVPGILVFLVTMVGVYMCSLNIVREKEVGTIEQINVTPIKKYQFILGKLIPFLIIGMFIFTVGLFGVARLLYGIVPQGPLPDLYLFLTVYLIALLGIGLLISTYSATQQQAMSLAFFLMMIFLLMSGLFTSVDSMPQWAQWIARLNPVTYFIEVMRMVVLKGSRFADISRDFIVICVMAVVFNGWAILNYRKTSN